MLWDKYTSTSFSAYHGHLFMLRTVMWVLRNGTIPQSTINTRGVLEIDKMCMIFSHICYRFLDSFQDFFQWFSGDPTFMEMKTAFWESPEPFDPLGADILCPRDGKPGCALVDWIDRDERREQSHFMSWTWQYRLMQVRSALEMYQANSSAVPADVFLDIKFRRF